MHFEEIRQALDDDALEEVDQVWAALGSTASRWLTVHLVQCDGWLLEHLTK